MRLNHSGYSEKYCRQTSRLLRERKLEDQTMDATGTAVPENQSRGCSQALLYNETRPHQAHGYRTPMAVWRQGLIEIEAGGAAGGYGHVDNARALPTGPQPQQQYGIAA
jgi:hypothetical protein